MSLTNEKLTKKARHYYSSTLDITNWEVVETELKKLLVQPINSADELLDFLKKYTEYRKILSDELSWRYIKMSQHADDPEYEKKFTQFYANIYAKAEPYDFKIKQKFYDSEFKKDLSDEVYGHLNEIISAQIEIFREENIPLKVQEVELANKYSAIISKMIVEYDGEEKTLQQLAIYLQNPERQIREEVWHLIFNRLAQDEDELNKLFDQLKELRVKIAENAGFNNYRDYMHKENGRFSYTPDDLYRFHTAVEKEVIPFLQKLNEDRKTKLEVDRLRPWDAEAVLDGKALRPFATIEEFIDKAVKVLAKVREEYGMHFNKMKNSDFLDLENRKGKAPGGYCSSIAEYGSSFIFMNAVGRQEDLNTIVHEAGHAMHSCATEDIPIAYYASPPHEVNELASMAMEFLTMEYWNEFYDDPEELKKAKREQLMNTLKFLPWCMIVDAFQHWIYTSPNHSVEERSEYFASLMERFNPGFDWSEFDKEKQIRWFKQLHIFEIPFYYIEYGMAQLGALAIYMNYKQNKKETVKKYHEFLQLGYSKSVKEIYETAGIEFDFSSEYIKKIVDFVAEELANLK